MKVVYSEECLLHDPPYEVTRGKVQAYVGKCAFSSWIKYITTQYLIRILYSAYLYGSLKNHQRV